MRRSSFAVLLKLLDSSRRFQSIPGRRDETGRRRERGERERNAIAGVWGLEKDREV